MKLFLIGGMEDLNFNYCYKITYESGETYDRRRNELSVEISKEDYKKIITGVKAGIKYMWLAFRI